MKNKFPEFYIDKEKLWKDAIFVFDTNAVLDVLRLPKTESDSYLKVLNQLKIQNKIWLPYQVCKEYHNNFQSILKEKEISIENSKKNLKSEFETIFGRIENENNNDSQNEPYKSYKILNDILKNAEKMKPDSEKLYNEIDTVFSDIGDDYNEDLMKQKMAEVQRRIKECIPPGYKDCDKTNGNIAGDIIIWFQIMDYAKEKDKNIIFITNDKKEDWFQNLGKTKITVAPRPELIKEFYEKTGKYIWIYTEENFIKEYNNNNNIPKESKLTENEENRLVKFMTATGNMPPVTVRNFSKKVRNGKNREIPYREHVDKMKNWFLQNYEDPQNACPYDNEDKSYVFLDGGPYDAQEVLSDKYGYDFTDEEIRIAAEELETENDVFEWAEKSNDFFK